MPTRTPSPPSPKPSPRGRGSFCRSFTRIYRAVTISPVHEAGSPKRVYEAEETMAYRNLREFVRALETAGELRRVAAEVSADLEIAHIADKVSKAGGPALLFENVTGFRMPVLVNAFGSMRRMAMGLGVEDIRGKEQEIALLLNVEFPESFRDAIRTVWQIAEFRKFAPRIVQSGPCQEIVLRGNECSLYRLPALKCWPQDGGKFLTLPIVITKNPETGTRNAGMYRMQVFDETSAGMHWHVHHDGARNFKLHADAGKRMEVAVALGGDPATIYVATAPLPPDMDEMIFAGFLRHDHVEMVKCLTVDMEVPAESEIVLEGYIEPTERRKEGPFGDHTGYYSSADDYPVFHLTCMTHRRDPIYPATVVGKPPMEDCYMGKATERLFLPLLRLMIPELVNMNLPMFGVFHNFAFISIKKSYPFQARKVMHALWGLGQLMLTKFIVVVDADVNVQDVDEVMWRVGANVDPKRDTVIVEGPVDVLDHAAPVPCVGSKMGIDATRKLSEEGHPRAWPDDVRMDDATIELVRKRWKEYGIEL